MPGKAASLAPLIDQTIIMWSVEKRLLSSKYCLLILIALFVILMHCDFNTCCVSCIIIIIIIIIRITVTATVLFQFYFSCE